jgi:threonine dehydrogenase-like Zn-dependent dehydrogenase
MVIDEVPEPGPPGPQDVIIRPEAVGICGSDIHVYSGDVGALSGARSFFRRVLGHEFSAIVERAGQGCLGGVQAGDRVAVWPLRGCGRCYPCRVGRADACVSLELVGIHRDGGLQQLLSVPESQVFGVGDLDPEPAAFIEPMSIAVHALDRADVRAGQQAVILGAGPIGLGAGDPSAGSYGAGSGGVACCAGAAPSAPRSRYADRSSSGLSRSSLAGPENRSRPPSMT